MNKLVAAKLYKSKQLFKISILCLLILISSGCKTRSGNESKEIIQKKEYVLKLIPGTNNPRNSEGDFITLKDGRILFVYSHFTTASDFGNGYLASRYSIDNGKTWSSEDQVVVDQEGAMNVMSVSLLRLQNGEIALFYLRKNSRSDCIPMMRISTDEAKTWSEPTKCITDKEGYFVLNNNRIIQLKNGRLIFAVAMHGIPGDEKFYSIGRLWSYYSDDSGMTWTASVEVANPGNIVTQEPGLVELKNGDIFMFIRTGEGVQYMSYSKDKGESWSPVEPSNIKSPRSPASISGIPSTGDLVMVWNNNGESQKRTPLSIAVSKDEGKTWEKIKTIEDDPDGIYCYMSIHFTDNYMLLGYTGHGQETIARLSLDWIYK